MALATTTKRPAIQIRALPPRRVESQEDHTLVDLPMTAADRQRVRRRLSASDGQEFILTLPTGTTLRVGRVLYYDADKTYIVRAAPEDVLLIRPGSILAAAQIGHLIGNMHRDIALATGAAGDEIITLWTAPLEARLLKEGFAATRETRPFEGNSPGEHAHSQSLNALLPPRYQGDAQVSPKPMGSAGLIYDEQGQVAWHLIWRSFCDLALAGGPTHRGTLLEAPTADEVRAQPEAYKRVVAELERAAALVTGLKTRKSQAPGWLGVQCHSEAMSIWLLRAIIVENVAVRRQGDVLYLPAGPSYRTEKELKNVVTVLAKTYHYWTEHLNAQE